MIFYCDLQGNLKAFQNETVYQGSNNVTTIYVVAPFSRPVGLNISFTKPNKLVTSPAIMKWVGTLGNVKIPVSFVNIPEQFTDTYNVWAYALPYSITEQNGVVGVSVNAVIADSVDASGQQAYKGNLTTFTGQFTVAYSALPSPPTDIPTEWTQDKVLDLLNNYYNDAIQKIGEMNTLKTNAKDTLVKAINEVFDEIAATNATIGDLSTLTTDEKTTIVGAINEVDAHADTAQQTAETAQTTADNATTLANNAVATANSAVATANEAKTTAQTAETNANNAVDTANAANATAGEAKAIAQGSQRAIGFATLQAAITALNGYSNTQLKVGDNVYIVETGVPDLWVAAVEQNSVAYNYTTNDAFNDDLVENTLVQVGYYKFAYLESDGKPCTVAWQNMTVAESDWVASTEFADFPYEAKIILTDFVNFSSIPQVVFGLTEATSGNYAPICKAGDKGVYIYSKVNTAITLPTIVTFAPNVHGASMQGGGYTNKGKWVASTTYAIDDLVYTDNGQYVCIEGITSTTSPEQDTQHWQATFVATGKTKNVLTISGQDNGTNVQKTFDGSQAVEVAFDETTMTAKEVNGVLKVGAKGTIPEALPQEASALKSGNLPTSGWNTSASKELFYGNLNFAGYSSPATDNGKILPPYNYTSKTRSSDWTGTQIREKNITYCNQKTDSNGIKYISLYFESGYGVNSHKEAEIQIYDDGTVKAWHYSDGAYAETVKIVSTFLSDYIYTISDTDITANSDVLMELTDDGETKSYSIKSGEITVIRSQVPTQPIPYTYKVKQTNASGQFTLVNHYVPTIPETPTALPQEASALKSGNLPTSGWTQGDIRWYWEQDSDVVCSASNYTFITNNTAIANKCWNEQVSTIAHKASYSPSAQTMSYNNSQSTEDYRLYGSTSKYSLRVHKNGDIYGKGYTSAQNMTFEVLAIGFPDVFEYLYTISDTDITENSDVLMELTDEGGVNSYSMEAGSITVIRDTVPTSPIPYTYKVKQTNASGQFTVINHFVPSVPESPTSLPVSYKKVSGELPTSGWSNAPTEADIWSGNIEVPNDGTETHIVKLTGNLSVIQKIRDAIENGAPLYAQWDSNDFLKFTYQGLFNGFYEWKYDAYHYIHFRGSNGFNDIYFQNNGSASITLYAIATSSAVQIKKLFTISDTAIKANSTVSMYLNSADEVRAYSKADGSVTVEMDSVPTTAIPYTLQVVETSAEGLFEVINDYVPTKTSQLTNDSGFITAADIPSATTLYEDSTGAATVTLSETINNGDIVRIKTNNGNVDHYYIGVAWNRTIMVTESFMVTDGSDVTVGTAINIDSLRFNIQDTSLILFHYFNTNITTAGAVTITNEKANVVIRKVERIHT